MTNTTATRFWRVCTAVSLGLACLLGFMVFNSPEPCPAPSTQVTAESTISTVKDRLFLTAHTPFMMADNGFPPEYYILNVPLRDDDRSKLSRFSNITSLVEQLAAIPGIKRIHLHYQGFTLSLVDHYSNPGLTDFVRALIDFYRQK